LSINISLFSYFVRICLFKKSMYLLLSIPPFLYNFKKGGIVISTIGGEILKSIPGQDGNLGMCRGQTNMGTCWGCIQGYGGNAAMGGAGGNGNDMYTSGINGINPGGGGSSNLPCVDSRCQINGPGNGGSSADGSVVITF
jgi:hypothetical protein